MATSTVVEGGGASAVVERMRADLSATGVRVTTDWRAAGPGVVCVGTVSDEEAAQQAVLAVLAGALVLVEADAPREVVDRMCDDLRRLGPLDHHIAATSTDAGLSAEERSLLDRLLVGDSLGDAAAALHLSRRTADRRLAAARRRFGVTTTAELLAAYSRQRR